MKTIAMIDGANTYGALRSLDFEMDYKKLLGFLNEKFDLLRINYYTAVHSDEDNHAVIKPLIDWLSYNGYNVIQKPTTSFSDGHGNTKIKGDMDIDIVVDMFLVADRIDHIILFSGDSDFIPAIRALQNMGIKVTVISTMHGHAKVLSDALRKQADVFIDIRDHIDEWSN